MAAHPLKLIYNKKKSLIYNFKKSVKQRFTYLTLTYRKTHHKMLKAQELQINIDQMLKNEK